MVGRVRGVGPGAFHFPDGRERPGKPRRLHPRRAEPRAPGALAGGRGRGLARGRHLGGVECLGRRLVRGERAPGAGLGALQGAPGAVVRRARGPVGVAPAHAPLAPPPRARPRAVRRQPVQLGVVSGVPARVEEAARREGRRASAGDPGRHAERHHDRHRGSACRRPPGHVGVRGGPVLREDLQVPSPGPAEPQPLGGGCGKQGDE
mmetsp:Transcript_39668/g.119867  ORF Transcript_39668/g.119867 Transcript_39668/m.119867 type:complete len:206 (-) Transcript_39668:769-1386(-)